MFQWQSIMSFSLDFFAFWKKLNFFFLFSDLGCSIIVVVLCLCPLKNNGFFFLKKRFILWFMGLICAYLLCFGFCLQSLLWNLQDLGFEKPFVLAF